MRERLSPQHSRSFEALLFVASHTHNAPALDPTKPRLGTVDSAYFEATAKSLAVLIGHVLDRPQRSSVKVLKRGRASSAMNACRRRRGLSISRRHPFIRMTMINAPDPTVRVHHELDVLVAFGTDDSPLWAVWSWPCHATSTPVPTAICADFPGYVRAALRARLGAPQLPVIYLPGFCGDVAPYVDKALIPLRALIEHPLTRLFATHTPDRFDRLCLDLAQAATSAVDQMQPVGTAKTVGYGTSRIELAKILTGAGPRAAEDIGVHALSFGDIGLLLVGAEVCNPYRDILSGVVPSDWLVSGLCNSVFGYLPTDQQITEGGYEATGFFRYFGFAARFQERVEHQLVWAAAQAVGQIQLADHDFLGRYELDFGRSVKDQANPKSDPTSNRRKGRS